MTRSEYLTKIASLLQDISPDERRDAMQFYNDYFDEAGEDNADQAIKDLGSPEEVARKIRESLGVSLTPPTYVTPVVSSTPTYSETKFKEKLPGWAVALIVIVSIFAFLFLIGTILYALFNVRKDNGYEIVSSYEEYYSDGTSEFYFNDMPKLELDIDSCKLIVVSDENVEDIELSTSDPLYAEIETEYIGETLKIKYNPDDVFSSKHSPKFTLTLPKDLVLDSFVMNVGAADICFNDTSLVTISKLVIDLGAGNVEFYDFTGKDISINCGAGNVEYEGIVSDRFDADLGCGNIELTLKGIRTDFDYNIDCAMGEINIDGHKCGGIGNGFKENNNANIEFDIDCALGECNISFK